MWESKERVFMFYKGNPFYVTGIFLYTLKAAENQSLSNVSRGIAAIMG